MKKFFALLLSFTILSLEANASRKSRIYIGADYLNTEAKHQYFEKVKGVIPTSPARQDASSHATGFGFNVGFKSYLNRVFVAPEIFFDQLNSSTRDFYAPQPSKVKDSDQLLPDFFAQDELAVNFRYGVRLNVGVNVYRNLNLFANIGIASVDYDIRWKNLTSDNPQFSLRSHSGHDITPIYGAGISYDINKHFAIKASQDFQRITATYVLNGLTDQVDLMVTRVGAAYSF